MKISGKAAVVVGGASGMARATAEMLVREGARVAILDLPELEGRGGRGRARGGTRFYPCDVTDFAGTEAALARGLRRARRAPLQRATPPAAASPSARSRRTGRIRSTPSAA